MTSTNVAVSVVDGFLILSDKSGLEQWKSKPLGMAVSKALVSPGGGAIVVLLDYMAASTRRFENLLGVDLRGDVVWVAQLPDSPENDAYVGLFVDDGHLIANSWAGYRVDVEWTTGRLLQVIFAK